MDDQQAGIWQMIMGMIGMGKKPGQQPPPPPPPSPGQTQGASTRDTVAAPNRQAYLNYAIEAQSRGEVALPYAQWLQQQRRPQPMQ